MQKEDIIINSIEKEFGEKRYTGQSERIKTLVGLMVNFDYKSIAAAKIYIKTGQSLSEEEIKDKIIEVIKG